VFPAQSIRQVRRVLQMCTLRSQNSIRSDAGTLRELASNDKAPARSLVENLRECQNVGVSRKTPGVCVVDSESYDVLKGSKKYTESERQRTVNFGTASE
jgi:hypothetical protein